MPASSSAPIVPARFHVRSYRDDDLPQILDLFEVAFGRRISAAHYRWKVLTHDAPVQSVWVAVADDRIVGQYACTPLRFKVDERIVWAAHGCDVMTAPGFRRQGVLTAVGSAANAAWRDSGIAFTTGLHYTGSWGSRRAHLGWKPQFQLRWVSKPLRLDRLVARRHALPRALHLPLRVAGNAWNALARRRAARSDQLMVREVTAAGSEFDRIWEHVAPHYNALVVRDRAWMAYRYFEAPDYDYRAVIAERDAVPVGYIVFRTSSSASGLTGVIADLFTAPRDVAASALLIEAAALLGAAGVDHARALIAPDGPLAGAFRRAGFVQTSGTFDASIVPLAADGIRSLRNSSRWFTLGGDFDVV
jgi:hypothetical protein